MESLLAAAHPRVSLSELMAALWINGFVNGREATGGLLCGLFTIAAIGRRIKSTLRGRGGEEVKKEKGLIARECRVVTVNALNNLFLRLLYKLVISIHLNINWIKI